ncbi:MAG: helix-turn-helix domain-containing protein [Ilumatobacteraceae bacterium]
METHLDPDPIDRAELPTVPCRSELSIRHVRRRTYSVPEVAVILGIGRTTAYLLVERGELRALRVGRRIVIACAEIDQLLGDAPAA